jgi:hypothetical protein
MAHDRPPSCVSPTFWLGVTTVLFALGVHSMGARGGATILAPLRDRGFAPADLGPVLLAASGIAWWLALRAAARVPVSKGRILAGFVLLRALSFAAAPDTSGDLHRYAWEAEVWLWGANPYVSAPDAPELAALAAEHSELHARVEHRAIPAAYPPLAQALFVASACAARGLAALSLVSLDDARPWLLRALALAGDVAVLLALARWLERNARPPTALVAWAWCPLVALEFAGAGHFDSAAIALAVFALTSAAAGPRTRALALAAGAAIKLLPAAFAPFAVREYAAPRERRRMWLWFGAAFALSLAPLGWSWAVSSQPMGLAVYASTWESTSALFRFLERPLWPILPVGSSWLDAKLVARVAAFGLWIALAVRLARRRADSREAAFALGAAFVLLSPTFHPWYATWIAPWLVVRSSAPEAAARRGISSAFACLLAAAPLQYVVLVRWRSSGSWEEPIWLWPLMFGPCLFLLCSAALRARRP